MDYPAPFVRPAQNGGLDFTEAYGVGIGPWDILSVRYSYEEFAPDADEGMALDAIAAESAETRVFVSDAHSRSVGSAHPQGSVWDNGSDPVAELYNVLEVRRRALADFGLDNLPEDGDVADLKQIFVPVYLYHRYQVAAAAKVLGGMTFKYSVKGDGFEGASPVPAARPGKSTNGTDADRDFSGFDHPAARVAPSSAW